MEVAVADLNARGGVLGERLRTVLVDDQCDAGAAVLAAGKLVAERSDGSLRTFLFRLP